MVLHLLAVLGAVGIPYLLFMGLRIQRQVDPMACSCVHRLSFHR